MNYHHNNGYSALIIASYEGQHECVESLIKAGADVNLLFDVGVTP